MKKSIIFVSVGVLIFVIGAIVSWLITNVYFNVRKEEICSSEKAITAEIPPEQIQEITSLEPGQVIYGKVESKQGNQIGLNVQLVNPLDEEDVRTISVNIPIEAKDEIVKFKQGSGFNVERIRASFDEIKIGDFLTIQILPDKKIIGLSIIEK